MEKKRERNDLTPITTCISPLWKDTTTNNVVTLRMPPPQTQLTSLDTFMAAHSPRRFCQARQIYILKPLTVDKRITEAGYVPVQQKTRNYSEFISGSKCDFAPPAKQVRSKQEECTGGVELEKSHLQKQQGSNVDLLK
ncbi:hypothetical protein P5673_033702, partial [Acropora cervicornis]